MHEEYFNWLVSKIWPSEELKDAVWNGMYRRDFGWLFDKFGEEPERYQWIILDEMDRIQYRYSTRIVLDADRATDAYDLRDKFMIEERMPYSYKYNHLDIQPVSVLEVLVALSLGVDSDLMGDLDYPEMTAPLWFWTMISNLKIIFGNVEPESEEGVIRHSVDYRCDQFLDRKYSFYGEGGPIVVENPKKDMRKTDLWMQMNWYLVEKFGTNSVI